MGRGRQALAMMNPLCTLRYSATHTDKHHMIYRLNAVDAYERKLVKQIEVAAGVILDDYNRPYVRLVATRRKQGNNLGRSRSRSANAGRHKAAHFESNRRRQAGAKNAPRALSRSSNRQYPRRTRQRILGT